MNLRIEQDGRVRRLTLAAPPRRNILDAELAVEFLKELRDAQAHPDTGAILVDAEGPVFCGGLDFAQPVPDEISLMLNSLSCSRRAAVFILASCR